MYAHCLETQSGNKQTVSEQTHNHAAKRKELTDNDIQYACKEKSFRVILWMSNNIINSPTTCKNRDALTYFFLNFLQTLLYFKQL